MSLGTRLQIVACLLGLVPAISPTALQAEVDGANPPEATNNESGDKPKLDGAESLSDRHQRIIEGFRHLQDVLLRMAELTRATDPRRSALLRKAVRQSEEQLIGVQLEDLSDSLAKKQLSKAIEEQEKVQKDLQSLLELLLSENRARRLESEKARIAEYLKRINRIIKQQKGLQGRTTGGDSPERLADEQGKLADSAQDLAKDIQENEEAQQSGQPAEKSEESEESEKSGGESEQDKQPGKSNEGQPADGTQQPRQSPDSQESEQPPGESEPGKQPDGSRQEQQPPGGSEQPEQSDDGSETPNDEDGQSQNPARPRIEAAQQRMREARKKLEEAQREPAAQKQEEAIRELEKAKAQLEEILRQFREEEIERMLATLEARFQKMLEMQREVHEGTLRLGAIPKPKLTHNQEIEASRLGSKESQIVFEADKALTLLHDDGSSLVFSEAVGQVRDDMNQVAQRLARAEVGQITQAIEEEIITALEEMLASLEKARQDAEQRQQQMESPPGEPQDQRLVDVLAEIKMIRAMQMRVNNRTERYSKLIQGEQAETSDMLEALNRLSQRQERIHQITRDLQMGEN